LATTVISPATLSPASEQLRETVRREARPFRERVVWAAEAFRETEGEPLRALRVAQATDRILRQMPGRGSSSSGGTLAPTPMRP
jgi:hypothetical protein